MAFNGFRKLRSWSITNKCSNIDWIMYLLKTKLIFFSKTHILVANPLGMSWNRLVFSHQKKQPQEKDIHKTGRNCIFEDLNTGIRSVLTIKLIWSLSSLTALRTLLILFSLDICSFPHTFLQPLHFLVFLTNLLSLLAVFQRYTFLKLQETDLIPH